MRLPSGLCQLMLAYGIGRQTCYQTQTAYKAGEAIFTKQYWNIDIIWQLANSVINQNMSASEPACCYLSIEDC